MCKSVRGAAFFGASVHSVVAIFFLLWFLFDTVVVELGLNLWRCEEDEPRKSFSLVPQYLVLLFKFIYYVALSITGIYMFRGVERASAKIIKYCLLSFVILQTISLFIFVTFVLFAWEDGNLNSVKAYEPVPTASSQFILQVDNMTYTTTNFASEEEAVLVVPTEPSITTTSQPSEPETILPTLPEIIEPTPPDVKVTDSDTKTEKPAIPTAGLTQKLTSGQLVSFVFEILGVVFNALGSVIYTGILVTYMVTL